MIYFTFNDAPSGVFKSQVVEVIEAMNRFAPRPIQLVACISLRNFSAQRQKIKAWYPEARVLPMLPYVKLWRWNRFLLRLVPGLRREPILARGPGAYYLAKQLQDRVGYDGRGAVQAELTEYPHLAASAAMREQMIAAEALAVRTAVHRIAVSEELVRYWQSEYGYQGEAHTVIPCTISESAFPELESDPSVLADLGWSGEEIILVYAGSTSGWQAFGKVASLLTQWLESQPIRVLFLSRESPELQALMDQFPGKVQRRWLRPEQVSRYLGIADYGVLIREQNVTNRVASPVKFAEYLAAGLKVLITPGIGDYSEMVQNQSLGVMVQEGGLPQLSKTSTAEKKRLRAFARDHLTKEANAPALQIVYRALTES